MCVNILRKSWCVVGENEKKYSNSAIHFFANRYRDGSMG